MVSYQPRLPLFRERDCVRLHLLRKWNSLSFSPRGFESSVPLRNVTTTFRISRELVEIKCNNFRNDNIVTLKVLITGFGSTRKNAFLYKRKQFSHRPECKSRRVLQFSLIFPSHIIASKVAKSQSSRVAYFQPNSLFLLYGFNPTADLAGRSGFACCSDLITSTLSPSKIIPLTQRITLPSHGSLGSFCDRLISILVAISGKTTAHVHAALYTPARIVTHQYAGKFTMRTSDFVRFAVFLLTDNHRHLRL